MPKASIISLLIICLFIADCGYSTRSLLPSHLHTIAIISIDNSTAQPSIAEELALTLPRIFNSDRNLRITSAEQADLTLSVLITSYSRSGAAYDADQKIFAYEISISAQIEAQDQIRNETFYSGSVTSRVSYNPETKTEEAAISEAVDKLCREIVRQIITAW
jgi:hypothetical protein|uniref:LptE family protein n=1 Tax=candidate division WOR-3 bacterium TaxID=2052148 RepID=A0A7V3UZ44_UNCW3